MNQNEAVNMLNCTVNGQSIVGYCQTDLVSNSTSSDPTLWQYWQNCYYPQVIHESYPIYIQQKAMDKGKQAFELLKALMDKDLVKIDKVKDFITAMDTILKTL